MHYKTINKFEQNDIKNKHNPANIISVNVIDIENTVFLLLTAGFFAFPIIPVNTGCLGSTVLKNSSERNSVTIDKIMV